MIKTGKEGLDMLSEKHAALAVKILLLFLAAALSFFVVAAWLPETGFIQE